MKTGYFLISIVVISVISILFIDCTVGSSNGKNDDQIYDKSSPIPTSLNSYKNGEVYFGFEKSTAKGLIGKAVDLVPIKDPKLKRVIAYDLIEIPGYYLKKDAELIIKKEVTDPFFAGYVKKDFLFSSLFNGGFSLKSKQVLHVKINKHPLSAKVKAFYDSKGNIHPVNQKKLKALEKIPLSYGAVKRYIILSAYQVQINQKLFKESKKKVQGDSTSSDPSDQYLLTEKKRKKFLILKFPMKIEVAYKKKRIVGKGKGVYTYTKRDKNSNTLIQSYRKLPEASSFRSPKTRRSVRWLKPSTVTQTVSANEKKKSRLITEETH